MFGPSVKSAKVWGIAGPLLAVAALAVASPASAAPLAVETKANTSNAQAGESGANVAASALITVLVKNPATGLPVANLGANVGNGTAAIALPAGWSLFTNAAVPPGGSILTPTQFYNWGNGVYSIRVVPFTGNPLAKWLVGDYHYVARISGANNGSALGVLTIAEPK
jgi:hypothetical protein